MGPVLMDATPSSMAIMWETDAGAASTVVWGSGGALDQQTDGVDAVELEGGFIHHVQLEGLSPDTPYTYQVVTGATRSDSASFRTPGPLGEEDAVRILALADMQRSNIDPERWAQVLTDGPLAWSETEGGLQAFDMMVIAGDLVADGSNHADWQDEFFPPFQVFGAAIPVFPVLGNEESDEHWYFDYFQLPEGGTGANEEHWWRTQRANLLIVGLDSNAPYAQQGQIDWLEGELAAACTDDTLDFVVTVVHHPAASELRTGAAAAWTASAVAVMRTFATECGKPIVDLHGSERGYSRGQAPESRHLSVGVGSAGASRDAWGATVQDDVADISISDDAWGWVLVEATRGGSPSLTIQRFSLGDVADPVDNVLLDSVVLRRTNTAPDAPVAQSPSEGTVYSDCATFRASPFVDADGDSLLASHWQVASSCALLGSPSTNLVKQFQNDFYGSDTQEGDDLSELVLLEALTGGSGCWRVRYRDDQLAWSEWSDSVEFQVDPAQWSGELLEGVGDPATMIGWDVEGEIELAGDQQCGSPLPAVGAQMFGLSGPCGDRGPSSMSQQTYISVEAAEVDAGTAVAHVRGWIYLAVGEAPLIEIFARDAAGAEVYREPVVPSGGDGWTWIHRELALPSGSRRVGMSLSVELGPGYADGLSLQIGPPGELDCATRDDEPVTGGPTGCCADEGSDEPLAALLLLPLVLFRRRR